MAAFNIGAVAPRRQTRSALRSELGAGQPMRGGDGGASGIACGHRAQRRGTDGDEDESADGVHFAAMICHAPTVGTPKGLRLGPYNSPVEHRRRQLESWCAAELGPLAAFDPLPVEASTRRFYRAHGPSGSVIAMDAPPATEDNAQFQTLSRVFRGGGVPVPEVLAFDPRGFMLVTDFGETLLERAYADGRTEEALRLALDALLRLQAIRSDAIPPYSVERFRDELDIFFEWLIRRFLGLPAPAFAAAAVDALVAATQAQPQATLHRDYHCRNLLLRDDGSLGVVDFQDALVGPVAYDLASLLRDCYHIFPEPLVASWRSRYLAEADCAMAEADFHRAFDLTGAQRHLKAAGIFARLQLRDGRSTHLAAIAPTLRRVVALGRSRPELKALAAWLDAEVLPALAQRLAAAPRP